MKKILLILATTIAVFMQSNAQSDSNAHYQGDVELCYSFGVGTFSTNRINLHSTHGVKVNKYFFAGAGIGLDYYHELYDKGELMMPLYVNAKGYLPINEKIAPFVSAKIGYGVGITEGVKDCSGVLWSTSVGIKIRKIQIQVGYGSQRISEHGIGIDMDAIQLGVGITF